MSEIKTVTVVCMGFLGLYLLVFLYLEWYIRNLHQRYCKDMIKCIEKYIEECENEDNGTESSRELPIIK